MASVVVTMDAREAALFRAQQKILDQQIKLNERMKAGGNASEQAGRKAKDSFDKSTVSVAKMRGELSNYVTGLASVTVAVDAIRAAWQQVREEQQAGLTALQRTQNQDRRLLQISASAEEFDALRSQADSLAASSGVDRATVREVIFSAVSENFRDAVPAIIAANQVVDPTAAAGVAGQVPTLFKGAIGALESVDLTLKAAQASRLDFEAIARSLPGAAEGGGIAKATAEETLAVLSVLAGEFKSGDTAADRIKAFATKTGIDENLAGIGIIGAVEKLQQMDAESRNKFLGESAELNVAFLKLSENLQLIKQRVAEFSDERAAFAAGGGLLAEQTAIATGDPRSAALVREARARQSLENAQAGASGVSGANAEAAALRSQEILLGQSFASRFANNRFGSVPARLASTAGADVQSSAFFGAGIAGIAAGDPAAIANLFGAFFTKQSQATAKLDEAATKLNAAAGRNVTSNARSQAAIAGGL